MALDGVPCVKVTMAGGDLHMPRITAQHPGSRIDLVACHHDADVRVAFVARGLPRAAQGALEEAIRGLYDPLRTWRQGDAWHGEGTIQRGTIHHPLLRLGAEALRLTDAPWLQYEAGRITAVLLPRNDMDLLVLKGQARRLVEGHDLVDEVRLGHVSLEGYQTWRALLDRETGPT